MAEVSKDLQRPSSPTLRGAEAARAGCQGLCPVEFWASPRMEKATSYFGNLFQHSVTFTGNKCLLCLSVPMRRVWLCLYIPACDLPPCPPSPIRSPLNRPFSSLSTFLSLSSCERCSKPLTTFMALCWTCSSISLSLWYWGAQNWTWGMRHHRNTLNANFLLGFINSKNHINIVLKHWGKWLFWNRWP